MILSVECVLAAIAYLRGSGYRALALLVAALSFAFVPFFRPRSASFLGNAKRLDDYCPWRDSRRASIPANSESEIGVTNGNSSLEILYPAATRTPTAPVRKRTSSTPKACRKPPYDCWKTRAA